MAPKKTNKKLILNKKIIASLETRDMTNLKGGGPESPSPKCAYSAWEGCKDIV